MGTGRPCVVVIREQLSRRVVKLVSVFKTNSAGRPTHRAEQRYPHR